MVREVLTKEVICELRVLQAAENHGGGSPSALEAIRHFQCFVARTVAGAPGF